MSSVVDICNLALGLLGDRATLSSIDPPEGSAQADHCANFWPIARDEALSAHSWGFATRTVQLTKLASSDHPNWQYAYAQPADFLIARLVGNATTAASVRGDAGYAYETGTSDTGAAILYTNVDDAWLRYTRRISDPTRYPVKVVAAMSYLMASYLAGPVIKGKSGVGTSGAMRQAYEMRLAEAKLLDADQTRTSAQFVSSGLRARGYGGGIRTIEDGALRYELPYWAQS